MAKGNPTLTERVFREAWPSGPILLVYITVWKLVNDENIICVNTLGPTQNSRHFAGDVFKWIFLNGNVWILLKILLKFIPQVLFNNLPALVQIMSWRRLGDKPLSEAMTVSLLAHICVTRPQWVNIFFHKNNITLLMSFIQNTWC